MKKEKKPTKDQIIKAYSNEIIRLTEWVKRLQEQLKEANDVIKYTVSDEPYKDAIDGDDAVDNITNKCCLYLKKWDVK